MQDPTYGICGCGCGKPTRLAPQNLPRKGWVKGEPLPFLHGHRRREPRVRWIEEDRGYTTPCWIWQLHICDKGYAKVRVKGKRLMTNAHRVIYMETFGPLEPGLTVDHLCRVRCCVNPAHMEPVSNTENIRRGLAAKLTPEKVVEIRRMQANGEGCNAIARSIGVHHTTISAVLNGRTWTDVR